MQLINQEEYMQELQVAASRIQSSINTAIAKIELLKSNQADPAVIAAITSSLNSASDALDAAVANS